MSRKYSLILFTFPALTAGKLKKFMFTKLFYTFLCHFVKKVRQIILHTFGYVSSPFFFFYAVFIYAFKQAKFEYKHLKTFGE
jgi:hypothetical protein